MAMTSPRYDLESSIEVARKLHAHAGATEVGAPTLATLLGYKSPENGAYLSRVGAAKQFGLIEGPSSAMKVTDRAVAIIDPVYPEDAVRARFEAFVGVPLFGAVFTAMEGRQLPPDKNGLRSLFKNQYGLSEDQASLAAARMMDSAEQAGMFEIGGRGKLLQPRFGGATMAPASVETPAEIPAPTVRTVPAEPSTTRHKLIEGALDELPKPGAAWSEEGLADWLALVEMALRVVYKLPAQTRPQRSEGPAPGSKPATPQ